jgi:hypothetical protein
MQQDDEESDLYDGNTSLCLDENEILRFGSELEVQQ